MKKPFLLCICLALTFIAQAQTEDKKRNIGFHAGISQVSGDLGNEYTQQIVTVDKNTLMHQQKFVSRFVPTKVKIIHCTCFWSHGDI
jgi:hypothetical protein